jgi:4-carboxymuconolactone decarboxylase
MDYPANYEMIRAQYAEVIAAYEGLGDLVTQAGPLSAREQRLVKLALALGAGLEGAVHSHARRALAEGVSADEARHACLLALTTIGFPAMARGMSWLDDVFEKGTEDASPA